MKKTGVVSNLGIFKSIKSKLRDLYFDGRPKFDPLQIAGIAQLIVLRAFSKLTLPSIQSKTKHNSPRLWAGGKFQTARNSPQPAQKVDITLPKRAAASRARGPETRQGRGRP